MVPQVRRVLHRLVGVNMPDILVSSIVEAKFGAMFVESMHSLIVFVEASPVPTSKRRISSR